MKLKCRPEDFQVEEQTEFIADGGPWAFYRLQKQGLGTPEVVNALLRRWNLPRHSISYGGMKDRHARTCQYLTIRRGPRRDLKQKNFTLTYLGQADRDYQPSDITGNRFHIVLRHVPPKDLERVEAVASALEHNGLPNYFDDQRFGSIGESGEFVAKAWCAGDYERALRLALAEPNRHDRPRERTQKRLLREHWNDWSTCKARLDRSHRRSIVTYLVDKPADFRGAFGRLRRDLRSLYLSAFQSYLWNLLLRGLLEDRCQPDQLLTVASRHGQWLFPQHMSAEQTTELRAVPLPLPSARMRHQLGTLQALVEHVLAEQELTIQQLRIKYPRDSFFAKGWRSAMFWPDNLTWQSDVDELYPKHHTLTLDFSLPRGSYATILIKRVQSTTERHESMEQSTDL